MATGEVAHSAGSIFEHNEASQLGAVIELSALAQDLEHQLPLLDAKRAGAELYGAPGLSLFDLLRPNENALSRVIADLLNPLGAHGQGQLFLNALLDNLSMPRVGLRDVVSVACEVQTDAARRIDIVVEMPTVLLGIENKPWAVQQQGQLSDYLQELENRARTHGQCFALVFLSDQEEESAAGRVKRLPYHASQSAPSLHGVLSSVVSKVRAPRARAHVEDFIRYIELEFGGTPMIEPGDEFYVEAVRAEFDRSASRKKALAVVMLAQSKLHAHILNDVGTFLLRSVREKLGDDFLADEPKIYDCLIAKHGRWSLRRASWPRNCCISLAADGEWFRKIYLGVRAPNPDKFPSEEACLARGQLENIRRKVPGGRSDAIWPWWRNESQNNWDFEFAARLVIESPAADVANHAWLQDLGKRVVQLAEAVEASL